VNDSLTSIYPSLKVSSDSLMSICPSLKVISDYLRLICHSLKVINDSLESTCRSLKAISDSLRSICRSLEVISDSLRSQCLSSMVMIDSLKPLPFSLQVSYFRCPHQTSFRPIIVFIVYRTLSLFAFILHYWLNTFINLSNDEHNLPKECVHRTSNFHRISWSDPNYPDPPLPSVNFMHGYGI